VTDDSHTPTDNGAPPPAAASDVGTSQATPERSAVGVVREEGTPGFRVVTLSGLPGAPTGETIPLGRADANNHSPSLSSCASDFGQVSRIGIVWIESPFGDTSGVGAVMLQRLCPASGGKVIDWAALATAANDNAVQVIDVGGVGAIGSSPTIAELATGHTCVAWIGPDGHARGHLYPPVDADDASDHPAYAAVNAALDDLGPVGAAPDGGRRLQISELRPGTFAVMWLALAQGGTVLNGSLLVGPADGYNDGRGEGWTQYAIPGVHRAHDFTGPVQLAFEEHAAEAGLEVTWPGPSGAVAIHLNRDSTGGAEATMPAAASGLPVGPSAIGAARKAGDVSAAADHDAAADLGALADVSRGSSAPQSAGAARPGEIVLTAAATPGEDETAADVETVGEGFAVAWQEPGASDQTRQLKIVLYDAQADQKGQEILVADDSAPGDDMAEIAALNDGLVAAYVDIGEGALVVKAYGSDGAQIGLETIVARIDDGPIVETALAANDADELAVAYSQQQHGAAGGEASGYGSIKLQLYSVATVDGSGRLVELGGDGDDPDDPEQPAIADGHASALELADGRGAAVIGIGHGFAVAWVEKDGPRETVKGAILDQNGAEVQRIDLSPLLGDAGVARGDEPTLLGLGGGSFLVSWLQLGADGDQVLMAAVYREAAPGVWLEPDAAMLLKAFADPPDDYVVSVSTGADGPVVDVIWRAGGGPGDHGPGDHGPSHEAVYSQRFDLDGRPLGDPTTIAQDDTAAGASHGALDSLAAAGLAGGQIVVLGREGSAGDHDLFAHLVGTGSVEGDEGNSDATDMDGLYAFTTRVDEETAINPLADPPQSGLGISHINGLPITTASPVDVGFGWVQLREDGWLTVTPDAGYRGLIAFDYTVAGGAHSHEPDGHVVVDVGAETAPAAVTLHNQVIAVAEDVSTASALKVADIAMVDGELGVDGLALTGLDSGMFEIVGKALYLKEGIELDFDTKPTLSVEILATHIDEAGAGTSFTLNVAGAGAAALAAADDVLVFAPGYDGATGMHPPLIEWSSVRFGIVQDLIEAGALTQEGDNVVITLNQDDPADHQKIVLKGAALEALGDVDFKFS
jgi:hypothetical protein